MSTLGLIHTALSLLGLASGLVVLGGLLVARRRDAWTAVFLISALAAAITGFGFAGSFGVPHVVGLASLACLAIAGLARYALRLRGRWRSIYAFAAVLALWSLVFFAIGEAFLRLPALRALAPTLTERPFLLTEAAALALFVALAIAAARIFRRAGDV